MKYKTFGFWRTLEFIPGLSAVEAYWKFRFGTDYKFGKRFLRPNGKTAVSHPCMFPNVCGCDHDVVVHGLDDIVAVCNCGRECNTFTLQQPDIVIYELNRPLLDSALASTLMLSKESDSETDIHRTTRIGNISQNSGLRFPVYLTTQLEKQDFANVVDGLLSRNDTPFILVAPNRELCTSKTEKRLTDRKSSFIPLSENVVIADNQLFKLLRPLKDILLQFVKLNFQSTDLLPPKDEQSSINKEFPEELNVLERKVFGEEVHWIVNGVDKGRFFLRKNVIKAKIIEILYDQIGRGWISHRTFMNSCAWKKHEYFRSMGNPGCMQRQLTHIRKFLGIQIEFKQNKGVRFKENIVKYK